MQPLKKYVSGHSTVTMCERLMVNLDMMKAIRREYMGKDGFDVHHTSRHCVQSPLPDQIKGAWFCLQKGFFQDHKRQEVECYPLILRVVRLEKSQKICLTLLKKERTRFEIILRASPT